MAPTTDLDGLAAFLLARFDEDEAAARDVWAPKAGAPPLTMGDVPFGLGEAGGEVLTFGEYREKYMKRIEPNRRPLDDIEAKRRIVKGMGYAAEDGHIVLAWVLEELARPYSEHPDFREEWRH